MKTNIQCKVLGLAFAGLMLVNSQVVNANVTGAESEGYGLKTHVGVLANSINLNVGPLGDAKGDSPNGVDTYHDDQSAINANIAGTFKDNPLLPLAKVNVGAGIFNGEALYEFDTTHNAMEASANSSLLNLGVSASVLSGISNVNLATVSGTFVSEAEVWGDYGNFDKGGSSYIEDLSLSVGLITFDTNYLLSHVISGSIAVDANGRITADANTGIDLNVGGLLGLTLLLNEQVENCSNSLCEMTVNAFHFSSSLIAGALADVDLTLGHSYAAMSASPSAVPVPAAVWLFGSGLMGLVGLGRRRQNQLAA